MEALSWTPGGLCVCVQVAAKQAEAFAELLLVRRVPAAYRQSLAECMRRYPSPLLPSRQTPVCGMSTCIPGARAVGLFQARYA